LQNLFREYSRDFWPFATMPNFTTVKPVQAAIPKIEGEEEDFKPLTADEARQLREKYPSLSLWWVVVAQGVVGSLVALAAWGITGESSKGWSVAWGALAVVIPAALFVRGLKSRLTATNPGAAVLGFFVWEAVKIALTLAMLFAAPKAVADLSWPAMLVGLVVTMKVYWVALMRRPQRTSR
jgi:ATP synthase protein I